MNASLTIQVVGALVGASCGLIGAFMVLRRLALLGDAISHSVLLGIVGVFWLTHSRTPLLMAFGAGAVGLLTVALVAWIQKTGLVREDAAIGLVFPFLFAVGVFLVSRFPSTVHIDVDAVLYGEIAYTPLYRLELFGRDVGTQAVWTMGIMLAANLAFILAFYKELKLTTFDAGMAAAVGISPVILHYALMGMVSATTVVAFDAVGAVLVVAMLIVPAATAQMLTRRLPRLLGLSALIGAGSAIAGYWLAHAINGSIAGAIATTLGLVFVVSWCLAPDQGLAAIAWRRRRQRRSFLRELLVAHIAAKPDGVPVATLDRDLGWSHATTTRAMEDAFRLGLLRRDETGTRAVAAQAGTGA